MKYLLSLFLAFAPAAPIGLTVADAAIVQKLPWCSEGNGYDSDKNGIKDGDENGGCTSPSDDASTQGTGYALDFNDCTVAGTMASFSDATANGSAAIRNPTGNSYLQGQVACYVTLAAGTYTVSVSAKTFNSSALGIWMSTSPIRLLPEPTSAIKTNLILDNNWGKWKTLSQTIVSSGTQQRIYFITDPGVELGCAYFDVSAAAIQACPTGTIPPVAQYRILDVGAAAKPDTVANAFWASTSTASVVNYTGFNSGTTATFVTKVLWKKSSNEACFYQEITANNLGFTATADDADQSLDSGLWVDFRLDQQQIFDASTYRIMFNIQTPSPAVFDANFPGGNFSSTVDFTGVTRNSSYSGGVAKAVVCFTLPTTVVAGQKGLMDFVSQENISGVFNQRVAFSPSDLQRDIATWAIVEFAEEDVTTPADTTPPTMGTPSFANVSNTSFTVSATCSDAVGCATATISYDTDSGTNYCENVGAPCPITSGYSITGTAPNQLITLTIQNLTPGQQYFVKVQGCDGAKNCTDSTENNTTTLTGAFFYVGATGSAACGGGTCTGTKTGTACADTSASTRCPQTQITAALSNVGDTYLLKNGTFSPLRLTGFNGILGRPITIRAENERMALMAGNGTVSALIVESSSYVDIYGLRIEGADNETCNYPCDIAAIKESNNIGFRRNLLRFNNRGTTADSKGLLVINSSQVTMEENEVYDLINHAFLIASSNNILRRNYVNPRDYPITNPTHFRAVDCYAVYAGVNSNNLLEDNICETGDKGLAIIGHSAAENNIVNGFISFNAVSDGIDYQARQADEPLRNNTVRHAALIFTSGASGPRGIQNYGGFNSRCDNCTIIGATTAIYARDPNLGIEEPTIFLDNALLLNNVSVLDITGQANWGIDFVRDFGNTFPMGVDSHITNKTTTDPSMGTCYIFQPTGSNLLGTGKGGANIGARILYRTINGVVQSGATNRLWDATTGAWRFGGAIITGVNSNTANSLNGFHTRVRVQSGGCSLPAGY